MHLSVLKGERFFALFLFPCRDDFDLHIREVAFACEESRLNRQGLPPWCITASADLERVVATLVVRVDLSA